MKEPMRCIVAMLVMITLPHLASAEIYGWVDKNGVKHFSNTPPPEGTRIFTQNSEIMADQTAEPKQPERREPDTTASGGNNRTTEALAPKTGEQPVAEQNLEPADMPADVDTQEDDAVIAYPGRFDRRVRRDRRVETERRAKDAVTGPVPDRPVGRERRD
jgi:hypothetical protein